MAINKDSLLQNDDGYKKPPRSMRTVSRVPEPSPKARNPPYVSMTSQIVSESVPAEPACGVTADVDWAGTDHAVCIVDAAAKIGVHFTVERTAAGLAARAADPGDGWARE